MIGRDGQAAKEVLALYQALKIFGAYNEEGASYAVFSYTTAALTRAIPNRIGPRPGFSQGYRRGG